MKSQSIRHKKVVKILELSDTETDLVDEVYAYQDPRLEELTFISEEMLQATMYELIKAGFVPKIVKYKNKKRGPRA